MPEPVDQEPGKDQPLIDHERFIRRVLRICGSIERHATKPKWQVFLESVGGAAFITVLVGGVIGGFLTARYQSNQSALEHERAKQQQFAALRFESSKRAFDLIFATVAAAEDVINLSSKEMALAPTEQRNKIRAAYNIADAKWRKQRSVIGVTMTYYSKDYSGTTTTWETVVTDVSKHFDCASKWIEQHPFYSDGLAPGCVEERKKVDQSVAALQALLLGTK